eukprot:scaffold3080_cov38-Tisochrysis_lutea.AAC.9
MARSRSRRCRALQSCATAVMFGSPFPPSPMALALVGYRCPGPSHRSCGAPTLAQASGEQVRGVSRCASCFCCLTP